MSHHITKNETKLDISRKDHSGIGPLGQGQGRSQDFGSGGTRFGGSASWESWERTQQTILCENRYRFATLFNDVLRFGTDSPHWLRIGTASTKQSTMVGESVPIRPPLGRSFLNPPG